MSADQDDFDVTAGNRDPWGPGKTDWGKPPLAPETVKRMADHARYCVRIWPKLSAPAARRLYHQLADMVLLLVEDYQGYDLVEPVPPLDHPDGGRRAD